MEKTEKEKSVRTAQDSNFALVEFASPVKYPNKNVK